VSEAVQFPDPELEATTDPSVLPLSPLGNGHMFESVRRNNPLFGKPSLLPDPDPDPEADVDADADADASTVGAGAGAGADADADANTVGAAAGAGTGAGAASAARPQQGDTVSAPAADAVVAGLAVTLSAAEGGAEAEAGAKLEAKAVVEGMAEDVASRPDSRNSNPDFDTIAVQGRLDSTVAKSRSVFAPAREHTHSIAV